MSRWQHVWFWWSASNWSIHQCVKHYWHWQNVLMLTVDESRSTLLWSFKFLRPCTPGKLFQEEENIYVIKTFPKYTAYVNPQRKSIQLMRFYSSHLTWPQLFSSPPTCETWQQFLDLFTYNVMLVNCAFPEIVSSK